MKIGILCACPAEFAPYEKLIDGKVVEHRGCLVLEGKLRGRDAAVICCGLGKVNAAIGAALLINDFSADRVVLSGVAGALADGLHIGDTVMVTDTLYHDLDAGLLTGYHPSPIDPVFQCDPELIGLAKALPMHFGRTVTGDSFIEDEGRAELIERFHPLTCDMETAAASHMCRTLGVPFNAVRAVSDTREESGLGSFEKNVAYASERACDVLCKLIEVI
ncbi:MAG: 5'-methylthioadenosine/S-adenosylhomocysteine nucleosidase [Oscillospiraceae bacterium]